MEPDKVSQEELAAEQAATQAPKEEELRGKLAEEFGFDPEADGEKLDKLVARELEHHKKLSTTIGQKIKYRDMAKTAKPNPEAKEVKSDALSTKDLFALTKGNVHEDDVEWLIKQAKSDEAPISQVLQNEEVQAVLKLRTEKRATAEAANTGKARPGNTKSDGASLIKDIKSGGAIPEVGSDDAEALFWARRGKKRS